MSYKNICKFPPLITSDYLRTTRFIQETDKEVMKWHITMNENRVYLISKGEGSFNINFKETPFQTGDLIFCFKNETVYASKTNKCEYMYIDFDGTRSRELFKRFGITDTNRFFSNFDGLIPFWHESLSRASNENIDLSSESILLYTFSRLSVFTPKGNSLVNKIIELSEENFRDIGFSISAIAEKLGYNVKYLSHAFSEKTGVTYSEYLRDLRIKYAVSLFDHGLDSVKNVAALSGFSDPLYFSTVFKNCVGVSPKEYKKRRDS